MKNTNNIPDKLNLCCGAKQLEGFWNVDVLQEINPDQRLNMKITPWPWESNKFKEIICDYGLTQIPQNESEIFIKIMNELWRILDPSGILKIKVGNAKYPVAFNDPMDCRYFTPETFDYFKFDSYRWSVFKYGFKPWKIIKVEEIAGQANPDLKDRLYVEMQSYKEKVL